jgi:surface antigen
MVWTAVAMMLTSGAMAVNAAVPTPRSLALYVVSALAAGLFGFSSTARSAAVPGMVERGTSPLPPP